MTTSSEPRSANRSSWLRRYGPSAAVGAVVVGAVGSGVWELLLQPGLSKGGRLALDVITLGSTAIKDAAYGSAALNPYPVAPLLALMAIILVPTLAGAFSVGFKRGKRRAETFLKSIDSLHKDEQLTRIRTRNSSLERGLVVVYVLVAALLVCAWAAYSVANQAVLIRRVFEANMFIVAPHLTELAEEQLWANFATVTTKDEYLALHTAVSEIAQAANVALVDVDLW
jgi:hypothetical protein